ncbi:MAG: hypothetical protein R3195_16830, partial [Gemmatimonadota bacterium]|nr:hypothetical protein [Gemmatimonadota bacterium]
SRKREPSTERVTTLRKLIRVAAVAFLVWAITTFAWAAVHHVTGVTGPAEASAASLDFVASAVTFVDPPGVLGAPQRFAARQIRQAADAVGRIHRGPERLAAQVVDELGHRHRHGRRGGHRHASTDERHQEMERAYEAYGRLAIPIDELDRARAQLETRAMLELERHRASLDRERRRIEIRRELGQSQQARIQRSIERVQQRIERAQAEEEGDVRRKLVERLRRILRELEEELGEAREIEVREIQLDEHDFDFDFDFDFEGLEIEDRDLEVQGPDGPIRIRIRGR